MKLFGAKNIMIISLFLIGANLFAQPSKGADREKSEMPPPPQGVMPPPPPPPKDFENIKNYRGNRTYSEQIPLMINSVKAVRENEIFVNVEIVFNQNINPRSVKTNSILINNAPLPMETRFSFNKRGDTLRAMIPVKSDTFKFKVQGVSSFEGKCIDPVEFLTKVTENK